MPMPISFDLSRYALRLRSAGVPQEQAEAHASALADVLNETPVALDSDLAILKADILARMDAMEKRMQVQFDEVNRRLNVMQTALIVLATVEIIHIGITMVILTKLL